jgi:hypothetical protein
MKKLLSVAVLVAACLAAMTGCSLLTGDDGKAYVLVTFNTAQADGVRGNFGGLPTGGSPNTDYLVSPGSYSGDYVLYWTDYVTDSHDFVWYSHYHTHFNQAQFYSDWGYVYGPSASSNLSYYESDYYASYHNELVYSITVNQGSFPFKKGVDKYFTLYLDWDPAASLISSINCYWLLFSDLGAGPLPFFISRRSVYSPSVSSFTILSGESSMVFASEAATALELISDAAGSQSR